MPKVFYKIGTWKLALKRQNSAFKTLAFGVYEIDPWPYLGQPWVRSLKILKLFGTVPNLVLLSRYRNIKK